MKENYHSLKLICQYWFHNMLKNLMLRIMLFPDIKLKLLWANNKSIVVAHQIISNKIKISKELVVFQNNLFLNLLTHIQWTIVNKSTWSNVSSNLKGIFYIWFTLNVEIMGWWLKKEREDTLSLLLNSNYYNLKVNSLVEMLMQLLV